MADSPIIRVHEPDFGRAEADAVSRCVLAGDASGNSPTVREFERQFAQAVRTNHALTCSSGTTALHLAIQGLGIGPGDEVIVPSFTFAPCADMVRLSGAEVIFVDSDPTSFNLGVAEVEPAITERTKAVMAVHLYGYPCELDALSRLCKSHGLYLIEDCAQALGASHSGQPVGSFGDVACYSFYANKHITTGEGGMVTTGNESLAERISWLRSHAIDKGDSRPYHHSQVAFNYRMPAFSAAVGIAQLERLPLFLKRRRLAAQRYQELLGDIDAVHLAMPSMPSIEHAFWAHSILVRPKLSRLSRDELMSWLRQRGVETRPFYYPLHRHDAYDKTQTLPSCEHFSAHGLVLPSGNTLTLEQVNRVCTLVTEACSP